MITRLIDRFRAIQHIAIDHGANIQFHKSVRTFWGENAQLSVRRGIVKIGFAFPKGPPRTGYNQTVIAVEEGGSIDFLDSVLIAPGAHIHVCAGAKLIMHGGNWIAHNATIIVGKHMEFRRNASVSWDVTLIDCDNRTFYSPEGEPIESATRPLILEDNCGLQMNVVIPKGVTIGENSMVGANAVVRRDVPKNCLAYQNPELKIREGVTTGLQRAPV